MFKELFWEVFATEIRMQPNKQRSTMGCLPRKESRSVTRWPTGGKPGASALRLDRAKQNVFENRFRLTAHRVCVQLWFVFKSRFTILRGLGAVKVMGLPHLLYARRPRPRAEPCVSSSPLAARRTGETHRGQARWAKPKPRLTPVKKILYFTSGFL